MISFKITASLIRFYDYMNRIFFPRLFHDYDESIPEEFVKNADIHFHTSILIGLPRIRQLRIAAGNNES